MNRNILTFTLFSICLPLAAQNTNVRPEDIDARNATSQMKANLSSNVSEGNAQQVLSWQMDHGTLRIKTTGGNLLLTPLQAVDAPVRSFSHQTKEGAFFSKKSSCVLHVLYGTDDQLSRHKSLAIDKSPQPAPSSVEDHGDCLTLSTTGYHADISKQQGYIRLYDAQGRLLVEEWPGRARCNAVADSVVPQVRLRLQPQEALYGLGQFRDGALNLRGVKRELVQFNTQSAVPVVFSTAGWGMLWDNPSRTLFAADSTLSMRSDYGKVVDYYLFAGNSLDNLVAAYRGLTGEAPLLPDWALGFHQSRNRYHSEGELMAVARRMKAEHLPMGSIFVDYHYWGRYGTGAMRFDEQQWPHLKEMLDTLHNELNTHLVITMWPCFKPGTANYTLMKQRGYLLDGARAIDGIVYDVYNPDARRQYRDLIRPLLRTKIDGWFIDGPEPDHIPTFLPTTTYLGPAPAVRNAYTLLHTRNFFQALKEERPTERPYMLTRCAWTGQQRYGTAVWSGDIVSTWDELQRQVVAGLSFTTTGIPYWTTDIGGYMNGDPTKADYRELYTRWFEWGTFCPIFRSHGRRAPGDTTVPNEMWSYGSEVQKTLTKYLDLRYQLMPYIKGLMAEVTYNDYTPMRHLAFDFASDVEALKVKNEFMFGPAFLVCPVIEKGARQRRVYLPKGARWNNYWTGEALDGGQWINVDAPLDRLPLFVRQGSVIAKDPTADKQGKELPQSSVYCCTSATNALTLDIYSGADGQTALYFDDGHSTRYQQGDCAVIKLHYSQDQHKLTIDSVHGKYPVKKLKLNIHIAGTNQNKHVTYKGQAMQVKL